MPVNNTIKLRRGTDWSSNPVLAEGEPGFDTTNNILKVGDGTTTWDNLNPIGSGLNYLQSHPNISSASSSDNSGRTYIQDVLLDGNGHVIGISTATESGAVTETNDLSSSVTWVNVPDANITESSVIQHSGALRLTESQIVDLQNYLTSFTETNDLSSAVTWANVPDTNITASSVVQHTGSLQIKESQIVDLQTYLTSFTETNDLSSAVTWANVPDSNITESSVVQHSGALRLTESQIVDLQNYLTSHPTIASAASSSDNSGRTYIQDILLDSNGHVTGITTETETVTDTNTEYTAGTGLSLASTELNVNPDLINSRTEVTSTDSDYLLIWDATDSQLKKVDAGEFRGGGGSTLTEEQVEDFVGGMVTGNTETGITVTYQDTDGTLDFVIASQTDENFTTADHSKLDGIEASADVTDTDNVTSAGALMDSEVTNLSQVKAFDSSDYATAAQGTKADSAQQPPSEGAFANGDKTKIDSIEAGADVTDTDNVTSAGALMDSELTDLAGVKGVTISTLQAKPSEGAFVDGDKTKLDAIEASADVTDATNVEAAGAVMNTDTSTASMSFVVDEDNMASDSNTKNPTQQSVKAYIDSAGFLTAHPNISAASSSDNSGNTFIQDITLDSNGHITALAVATATGGGGGGGISNVVEDTTPQIGGNLDLNSKNITGTGHIDITGSGHFSAKIEADSFVKDGGTSSQFLKADGSVDTNTYSTTDTQLTEEQVEDFVGGMVTGNTETGITVTYQDDDGTIDFVVASQTDENFTTADHSKLDGIEASADVTDTANVTSAGALMDSEVTNLSEVKAFASSDYATAAQGTKADSAQQPPSEGAFANGDKTKLDGIEASADVTDTANVTSAGALMDSEVTNLSQVKAFDSSDYATATQGTKADSAQQPPSEGAFANGDKTKLDAIEASADVTDTANVTSAGALMDSELTDLAGVKGVTISTLQVKPSEGAFADGDKTKLDAIEASADVTDTANVTSAGALMDSELSSITDVKALDQSVIAGASPNLVTTNMTDASNKRFMTDAQETKLDSVESNADVTDTTNVVAALSSGTGVSISAGGVISVSSVALTTIQTASDQTAHLALTAQEGDVVVRSDENKSYVHNGGSAGTMSDYTLLLTPTDAVLSVAGNTGAVTAAQIKTAYEGESNTNAFTDADHSKLDDIEASADITDTANVTSAGALMDSELTDLAGVKGVTISTLQVKPSEGAFADGDKTKLDSIEASADVTDTTNVTSAGALMDSEVTNLSQVKAFDSSDYATAAQGTKADSAQQPPSEGAFANGDKTKLDGIEASATADQTDEEIQDIVGAMVSSNTETGITVTYQDSDGTIDFVVASQTDENFTTADHSKLDGIEASADVTDTANVTAAGALMDSELTDLAGVKGVTISTLQSKPSEGAFANGDKTKLDGIEASADVTDATNVDAAGAVMNSDSSTASMSFVVDEDNMASDSATKVPTQQSVKAYVDANAGGATLTEEQVEDFVGGMVTGNTETFITVTYEDSDGTLDFVVPVKDEDNMASDSATHLATQQSIKAYVDANAGGSTSVAAISADATISSDVNLVTTANTDRTVTLPSVSSGKIVRIKKVDAGTGTVIIARGGSSTIDGATQVALYSQFESMTIICDGTNWHVF